MQSASQIQILAPLVYARFTGRTVALDVTQPDDDVVTRLGERGRIYRVPAVAVAFQCVKPVLGPPCAQPHTCVHIFGGAAPRIKVHLLEKRKPACASTNHPGVSMVLCPPSHTTPMPRQRTAPTPHPCPDNATDSVHCMAQCMAHCMLNETPTGTPACRRRREGKPLPRPSRSRSPHAATGPWGTPPPLR